MDVKTEIYKLKERLSSNRDEKIEASLQRLKKLPVDLDLLLETGIGKAVNKFCSHEKFGNTAKDLVAKWKKNAAKCAAQNGIEYTEVPAEVSSKNSRKVQNNEPKKVKYETYKTSDHRVSSSEYDPADSGYERKRHNNNNNDNNTKKQKTDDKHKKKKHIDKKNDTFTPNCGSFEDILGACDKKVSKPKCAPINDSNLKPNQTDDVERRNSFDDIDWGKILPKTATDYRPQHLPDFMEYSSSSSKRRGSVDEVVDANLFSSKKDKNKVFSGRRTVFLNKIPTLFDSCIRVLCDNIDGLGFTGGVPYDILKPVLERATPEQLFRLEDMNPYLVEDTDGLWENLCKKDFRNPEREELESWREVYERLLEERERKLEKVKSAISASKIINAPARKAQLAVAKAPREVRRQQIKYGTGRHVVPTAEELIASRRNVVSNPDDRTKIICRPSSSQYEAEVSNKKRKPTVAPLMAKTLKMLKSVRK